MSFSLSPFLPPAARIDGAKKANAPVRGIAAGLGIALLTVLVGCVGYVDGGYGGVVAAPEPDVYIFGGGYEHGRDVHFDSHRGHESRAVAHPPSHGPEKRR